MQAFEELEHVKVVDEDMHSQHQSQDNNYPNDDLHDPFLMINFLFHFYFSFFIKVFSSGLFAAVDGLKTTHRGQNGRIEIASPPLRLRSTQHEAVRNGMF